MIIILVVCIIIISIACVVILNKNIAIPVQLCADRIEKLADGDLDSLVPDVSTQDEIGKLHDSTEKLVNQLKDIISDQTNLLGEMAQGNLNISSGSEVAYVGGFKPLLESLDKIVVDLTDTMYQIYQGSDQVANGADQVASGAQALSQGATQQASSVQQLSATIVEISEHINTTAKNAVEAARADAAGKGFAVVADEVRNLAGKSAEAAKSTTALIESAIKAIENGTKIADETANSLLEVVEKVNNVSTKIGEIATASEEQATAVTQLKGGIEQISAVIQTNSATSEESASASEELSGQAQMLKQIIGAFKLKDVSTSVNSFQQEEIEYNPGADYNFDAYNDKY